MKMIDTITLTLNSRQFTILEPGKFIPNAMQVLRLARNDSDCGGYISCLQSATVKEKKAGIYKPKLILTKRADGNRFFITLRVEFSAPKLLFGNNFDELAQSDFSALIKRLAAVLADMGVKASVYCLKKANISAIHYSKNLALDDYTSSTMILHEISRADMTARLDVNKTDYRNGGHAIKWHANSYEITFYDKVKDMQQARKSEKRAVEHASADQMDFFIKYIIPKSQEILRIEVRFNTRKKLADVLKKIDSSCQLSFRNLYSECISREILLYYWNIIINGLSVVELTTIKPEDIYLEIERNNPGMQPAKIAKLVGIKGIIDSIGLNGLKNLMKLETRSWQRIKHDIRNIGPPTKTKWQAILQIEQKLKDFQLIKIQRT